MEYQPYEDAGVLHIDYEGPAIDLLSMGAIQLHIQDGLERLTASLFIEQGRFYPFPYSRPYYRYSQRYPEFISEEPYRPVKAILRSASASSFHQSIGLYIAVALANPDVRAVLQNLLAEFIFAVSSTRLPGLKWLDRRREVRNTVSRANLAPAVVDIVQSLSQNAAGKRATLRFTHEKEGERLSLEIEIDGSERPAA